MGVEQGLLALIGAADFGGAYEIEQSLRFDGSSHLNFTPSSTASTRRQMTFSFWSKHDGTYNIDNILTSGTGSYYDTIVFDGDTCASAIANSGATGLGAVLYPAARLRDPSAWLHYVMVLDTPNATASDRLRIYINGERVTAFASSPYAADPDPGQNYDTKYWNTTATHRLGSAAYSGSPDRFFSGYLAEVHCVFGSALDPTDFGEFDDNGVWRPIAYTGSYGTNGFYLKFDPSATNGIGHDHSGNGNNWTASGFTTSGTGTDVMSDTPTTNWCTLNPISNQVHTLSNGNLDIASASGNADTRCNSTIAVSSGKWYYEVTLTDAGTNSAAGIGQNQITNAWPGNDSLSYAYGFENAVKANNGSSSSYGSALGVDDVFMCAFDLDNSKIFFGKNGTWFDSSDPAAGTNSAYTLAAGTYNPVFRPYELNSIGASFSCNFGQRDFEYTPPTGFNALNTANLPAPDIADGSDYFNTVLYTGNGGTKSITGVGFQPDFTWIKKRDSTGNHMLTDVVRGPNTEINSNTTADETANTNALTSFDTDGFSVGADGAVNINNEGLVAWNWLAGGSVSADNNTSGSITSTVSANPSAGFSIVTYTGTDANATVGHGLGVAPAMVIVKDRDNTNFWVVGHKDLGGTGFAGDYYIRLNDSLAGEVGSGVAWNSTNPTSTVFSIGTSTVLNGSGNDHIAYCFAEVEGYSKFGSYTGTGGQQFVHLGFSPEFVMIKRTDSSSDTHSWFMFDATRDPINNNANEPLIANKSFEEGRLPDGGSGSIGNVDFDFLSNGFGFPSYQGSGINASGATMVYAAFAKNPFGGFGISPATAR